MRTRLLPVVLAAGVGIVGARGVTDDLRLDGACRRAGRAAANAEEMRGKEDRDDGDRDALVPGGLQGKNF